MACTNNAIEKAAEVREQLGLMPSNELIKLLHRGAFRHREDVAYAVIMLDRGHSVEEIERDCNESYVELARRGHRCDPVLVV